MGELDRRSGIGFMRLATVQRNAENQQQSIAARKLEPIVAIAFDPTLNCRLQDARGERAPCRVLGRNLIALSPGVHLQRDPTTGFSK
jgi:hypothetical protein